MSMKSKCFWRPYPHSWKSQYQQKDQLWWSAREVPRPSEVFLRWDPVPQCWLQYIRWLRQNSELGLNFPKLPQRKINVKRALSKLLSTSCGGRRSVLKLEILNVISTYVTPMCQWLSETYLQATLLPGPHCELYTDIHTWLCARGCFTSTSKSMCPKLKQFSGHTSLVSL